VRGDGTQSRDVAQFEPRFRSSVPGRIEAAVVAAVFIAIGAISYLVVQIPGPLVVHLEDDRQQPILDAQVRCSGPDGRQFTGPTDVFGEAKWPGLAKGAWKCEIWPPEKFHSGRIEGYATVVPRKPAMWVARVERPASAVVQVARPEGQARAAPAVRAVCEKLTAEDSAPTWEARAGLLDGRATLFLPHGRSCRIGLVRPERAAGDPGPVTDAKLSCASEPCSPPLRGGVGEQLQLLLKPTSRQWEEVRPSPEPD